ncbi:uncharacterized protein [Struthio camelus]|uniref:uncharacterized protein isoform X2 n=1 Tax=Struthio camelus TaxID=8801 RepID=UPI003603BB3A
MKPLPSPAFLPLLLVLLPGLVARRPARPAPAGAARPAPAECGSYPAHRQVDPGPEFSWILAYVSMRSCHRVLQDKYGEFSPPAYHSDAPISFWCNWTIQAGSRKHIIIYIQGFMTKEDCNKNEDKILFEGVSSLVEDSVVYACWKKEMHVFATFAEAVHVVLLKTYLPNCRDTQFKGKYYIFHDEEGESSSREDLISETPSKVPKRDHILQSGVMEDLRDVLSFATTASLGSLDKPTAVSTLIPVSHQGLRTELLETNAPYVLGCLWPAAPALCGQDPGRGSSWSASPTATLDTWRPSLSMSGDIAVDFGYIHGFSSVLSETPLLGALEGEEPFLGPAGVGLESRQVSLNPSLQPKDLGDPQFNIKPTHMSDLDLAAPSQALSPSREEGIDPAVYQGLSTVGLEKTKRCPLLSSVADGAASSLAESLMPSLTSQNDLVNGGHSPLLPGRSFFEALSVTEPELRTSVLQHMTFVGFPAPGSFRGVTDEVKKVLHPTASWDILRGQPQLSTQSSHVLQLVPTDPRRVGPCSDHVPCAPSLGVKNCGSLSSTVTQLPLAIPLLPAAWGCAPSTSEPVFSTLGMEMTPMLVCPSLDPASTELGSPDFTLAASLPAEQTAELGMSEPFAVFTANAEAFTALPTWELGGLVEGMEPPVPAAFPLEGLDKAWTSISPSPRQGSDLMGPFVASSSCLGPGVRKLVLDGDGEEGSWRGEVLAPAGWADKGPIPAASAAWQQVLDPQLGMGLPQPEDLVAASLPSAPVSLPSDDPVSQNIRIPAGGERHKHADLASVLASLENDTVLRSQHHPGDVLFEVTIETKHVDWVPRGGSELRKDLLESMKSHIRENLKLSTNRVNEIKLKEIRRVGRDNLLLTFWLHLKPEERNLSLALQSQLQELLGTSVGAERPRLVSLFVEDVNECNLGLCGEEADCFNGVGTYLCRCKKDYEDHSPTKSGTLCIPAPRSGISFFFRHPEVLVGAAVSSVLVLLVAVGILCGVARQRRPTGDPCPEEPGAQSEESSPVAVVMELNHLDDCLRLEPFQLKVRARPPDWISQARASPGQAYGVFIEQDESL